MKPTELFEEIMVYIDEHVKKPSDEIKQGFARKYGLDSNAFGKVFNFITNDTLTRYIRRRKLYFASRDLRLSPEINISDIAFTYGFSDQPAFTNAFRTEFGITPYNARLAGHVCANNRCRLESYLLPERPNTVSLLDNAFNTYEEHGCLMGFKAKYLEDFIELSNEYDFDVDTCYAIAELAERLDVPLCSLFSLCFDAYVDARTDIDHNVEIAIDLGLSSKDEIDEICRFHNCEYYDLDCFSVASFRKGIDIETYFVLRQDYGLSDDDITQDVIKKFRRGKLK